MQKHLAIFSDSEGQLILEGKKTIESRFSKKKIAPFGLVSAGDVIYIKPSGKDIIGQFKVKRVVFIDGLDVDEIFDIKKRYSKELAVEEKFWRSIEGSKYCTLIFISQVEQFITPPIKISKKDHRGWVVLN